MTLVDRIEHEIRAERARQDEKWGVQNHPMTFPSSLRDASLYRSLADAWKAENDHRVAESRKKGVPADRGCAWDGILGEEFSEAFAEERPGLQYAEMVQTAGVAFAILEFLNRQAKEQTGHLAWCPALDVDWILTAPELCDCEEAQTLVEVRIDGSPAADADPFVGVLSKEGENLVVRPLEDE